jgi:hypothetical protein
MNDSSPDDEGNVYQTTLLPVRTINQLLFYF